jgi:hypothetical protein
VPGGIRIFLDIFMGGGLQRRGEKFDPNINPKSKSGKFLLVEIRSV